MEFKWIGTFWLGRWEDGNLDDFFGWCYMSSMRGVSRISSTCQKGTSTNTLVAMNLTIVENHGE